MLRTERSPSLRKRANNNINIFPQAEQDKANVVAAPVVPAAVVAAEIVPETGSQEVKNEDPTITLKCLKLLVATLQV